MNSKGTLADLEAAHERVLKTTPQSRAWMRKFYEEHTSPGASVDIRMLLDDFADLEAELAVLRRVEERLRAALEAVRDDAYLLGEDCDEHNGNVGDLPECPSCHLALMIDEALTKEQR